MSNSAPAKATNRPLSPHLQVYKPQLTSVLSITHRATGIALSAGTLLLCYWIISAARGPASFAQAQWFVGSPVGMLIVFGWSVSLFFHLSNGIRHLFWDAGYGFDLKTTYSSGYMVLIFTCVLTAIAWAGALVFLGVL